MFDNFDVLPCGYLSFGDDGIIAKCNSTLATWVGFSGEELTGKSIETIFTLSTRIFYNTHFFPLIKLHSQASEIFLTLKGKDGNDLPVLANARRSATANAAIIHCVFVRVEERKKYEQEILTAKREAEQALQENHQLAELKKSLEHHAMELDKHYRKQLTINENLLQFSKIISHDLQEPIRKTQIFLDLIARDAGNVLSSKTQMFCTKIEASIAKLAKLTTGLQQYIAIDSEKSHLEVNLNDAINAARNKVVRVRQHDDFDLKVDDMPNVEGYANQLELMFFHLIDNAVQFRHPERRLFIEINAVILEENSFKAAKDRYRYTDHVRISFHDNGLGFPPEYKDYVFELLKKTNNTGTSLGIGLSLVKKIVDNHFGHVRVESVSNKGVHFTIEFPLKMD